MKGPATRKVRWQDGLDGGRRADGCYCRSLCLSICSAAVWQFGLLKRRIPLEPCADACAWQRVERHALRECTPRYLRKPYLLQELGSVGHAWRRALLSHYILVSGASLNINIISIIFSTFSVKGGFFFRRGISFSKSLPLRYFSCLLELMWAVFFFLQFSNCLLY